MKKWLSILLPLILLVSLVTWRFMQKTAEKSAQTQMVGARAKTPASVALGKVEVRDLVQRYEAMGSVEAPLSVKVAPKLSGRIDAITVQDGDRVIKGQILARIDASDVESQLQQAKGAVAEARYRLAQAQMGRDSTDVSVNTQITLQKAAVASAAADYEQARKSAEAQLNAAQANLQDSDAKIANARAAIKSAQANVNNAQSKFNRASRLLDKGFVAAQDVDDAKAALTVQNSTLEITEGQLRSAISQRESVAQQYDVIKAKVTADTAASSAKLTQAKASLEYAKANTSEKGAYRQSIAALQSSVAIAQATQEGVQMKRQDTVLRSPLDGFVTDRFVDPGAIASPTQPVLAVQFTKQIWVNVPVPDMVCAGLRVGQPAMVVLDAFPNRKFEASVLQINPAADAASRQFTIRVVLPNADSSIKPGMFARVQFEIGRVRSAVVVPREAVQTDREGSFVMTVDKQNTAKRINVIPQGSDDSYVNIGSALKPGSSVVIMSASTLKDGQQVRSGAGHDGKAGGRGGKTGAR
ncbi:MAG: efflux RND transporter periplasmic adaptor subunit [Armatimonadota bacterium]